MNKKGYMLIDALIAVVITANMCFLCFSIYQAISSDERTNERFEQQEQAFYFSLFNEYPDCEVCEIDESD